MSAPYLALQLRPVLPAQEPPTWAGSVWVGEVWRDTVDSFERKSQTTGLPIRCELDGSAGYRTARLLVRSAGRTHGFIDLDVHDGLVDFDTLKADVSGALDATGTPAAEPAARRPRTVTVVICTRNRPAMLRTALESVLAVQFGDFDVIVVDNASSTDETADYVRGVSDPRVRLVVEPRPGLSRARNAALRAATTDVVAFVDDDVVVDPHWLDALTAAFDHAPSVSCVSGTVPAGEIRTPTQADFDRRVHWSASFAPRVFDWDEPPGDIPLFPFAVGEYGTGANFAVDRAWVLSLGGFDENLGAGAPTQGGEDIDMFFRVLHSRRRLVHEPAAIVWHRHRDTEDDLNAQMRGYGLGLGAWLSKIATNPVTAVLAVKTALTRARALRRHLGGPSLEIAPAMVLRGAWIYQRARLSGWIRR
ncbi:glycosyltransferase family 2 protein [Mycolicibacterium sp.]|uniref:glycosyltransferase family 2 protein n=1 Tax=Mycolicibacterium sp. TaxID=2320850 RepID=UPI003D0B75EF